MKVLVIGGTGYIGARVVHHAIQQGYDVASVSRSGAPPKELKGDTRVQWHKGDMSNANDVKKIVNGYDAVISTLGIMGTNEEMVKVNGHANVDIFKQALQTGAKKAVYISATPSPLLQSFGPIKNIWPFGPGYFEGKKIAEDYLSKEYGKNAYLLRPGPVYTSTWRAIELNKMPAPLAYYFEFLWKWPIVHQGGPEFLPDIARDVIKGLLQPPIHVDVVARAAVGCLNEDHVCKTLPADNEAHFLYYPSMTSTSDKVIAAHASENEG